MIYTKYLDETEINIRNLKNCKWKNIIRPYVEFRRGIVRKYVFAGCECRYTGEREEVKVGLAKKLTRRDGHFISFDNIVKFLAVEDGLDIIVINDNGRIDKKFISVMKLRKFFID